MLYREATSADTATIAKLHAESWRATYRGALTDEFLDRPVFQERIDEWQRRLSSPPANQFVVLAEEGGRLCGFACAYGNDDASLGTLLDNLHVRADLQGSGIGKRLVAEVARWCAAEYPKAGLHLGVLEQNARARRFYQGIGATDAGGKSWERAEANGAPLRTYAWSVDQVRQLAGDK